jgi:hypothetical protein
MTERADGDKAFRANLVAAFPALGIVNRSGRIPKI